VAALPAASLARDAGPAASRLGFSLYGMKSLPLEEALAHCAAIGYRCVELAIMPGWPADPAALDGTRRRELAGRVADLDLEPAALMEDLSALADDAGHRANLERIKAAAELGHALAPRPPIVETILGGKPHEWATVKDRLAGRLADWAAAAEAEAIVVAVKAHVGGALHLPADARWLVDQVDSPHLRAVFDYSHFQLRGLGLAEALDPLADRTSFIHVKDAQGTPDDFQFLLPGDGTIDYAAYFRLLRARDYAGPVVVEVSSMISRRPDYDPVAAARRSFENLAGTFAEAFLDDVKPPR
jgi:inosose dehydratase